MKTPFLARHAKSSWDETALPDKDRPLNDRGKRDAPNMGTRLAKRAAKPDLILSSPARRFKPGNAPLSLRSLRYSTVCRY